MAYHVLQMQQLVATTSAEAGAQPPDTALAAEARPEPLLASPVGCSLRASSRWPAAGRSSAA